MERPHRAATRSSATDAHEARALDQFTRLRARQRLAVTGLWLWMCLVLLWLLPAGRWSAAELPPAAATTAALLLLLLGALPAALYVEAGRARMTGPRVRADARRSPLPRLGPRLLLVLAAALAFLAPAVLHLLTGSGLLWQPIILGDLVLIVAWGARGSQVAAVLGSLLYAVMTGADAASAQGITTITVLVTVPLIAGWRWQVLPAEVLPLIEETRARLLRQSRGMPVSTLEQSPLARAAADLVVVLHPTGVVRSVSPAVDDVLGYAAHELTGADLFALVHPDDAQPLLDSLLAALGRPAVRVGVAFRVRHRDGEWRDLEGSLTNLLREVNVGGVVLAVHDVTGHKRNAALLIQQALYDDLTGLANRRLLTDRLSEALATASRDGETVAVLFLDLDRFKDVNDRYGHSTGDGLLTAVAARLSSCLRAGDTPARFGGDEFVVLLERLAGPDEAPPVARRILAALCLPFMIEGHTIRVAASIGIAIGPSAGEEPDALLRRADHALYEAKARGRGRFVVSG